jgi:hypothetical protein
MTTKNKIKAVRNNTVFVSASFEPCAAFMSDADEHVCAGCGWLAEDHATEQPAAA